MNVEFCVEFLQIAIMMFRSKYNLLFNRPLSQKNVVVE